jgi:hypothetical protein
MTREDEFIGQLEGYLDEYKGLTPLPDAVRDAVRAQLPTTRQIGPFSGPMRYVNMITSIPASARYGLVAAVVVAAAALGATFLGSKTGAPSNPTPMPLPLAAPWGLPAAASLQAGRYVCANPFLDPQIPSCDLGGPSAYRTISFTVPDGWATADGLVFKHRGEANEVALSFWVPNTIYADPCHWQASGVDLRQADLVTTLRQQPGHFTSPLTAVRIFDVGYQTSRLEVSVPAELDIATCDGGQYRRWTETWASQQGPDLPVRVKHDSAGQVDVLYLVDADRGTLVIDASHVPAASAKDLSELEAIVASIKID